MECTEVILKMKHDWPIQEMTRRNIGKIPVPIQDMYVDDEEAYFEFGADREIKITLEEEVAEIVLKDPKFLETALKIMGHLVRLEEKTPDVELGFMIIRFALHSAGSDSAPLTSFNHLVESLSREGNRVDGLAFWQENQGCKYKVTAMVGQGGLRLSYTAQLQGKRYDELCHYAQDVLKSSWKAAEKTFSMLMKG